MKKSLSKLALGFLFLLVSIASNAHNTYLQLKGSGKINEKVEIQLLKAEYGL